MPLMISVSFGVGALVIPIAMSGLYTLLQFRTSLDFLGVILSINAVVFGIHAAKHNWGGKKAWMDLSADQEELQEALLP